MPRWQIFDDFLRPVFASSCVQHVLDLHLKFGLRRHHFSRRFVTLDRSAVYKLSYLLTYLPCVEVWQTSNLRRLRIGEENKDRYIEEEEETTG